MDVCDRGGIPGTASQRTRLEGVEVVSSTGYDHFYDFIRQAIGRFVRNIYPLRLGRIIEGVTDVGFTLRRTVSGCLVLQCERRWSQNCLCTIKGDIPESVDARSLRLPVVKDIMAGTKPWQS